ncbi:MAG TPA: N-acetyltransferase [Candidatus Corynebacterium gallistercoris]|uniref:N-acetyltransferase n=1 Tax=Candidatus Corynebacterium gallistercoris TaxID=2838530 RepID=A0A9D1UQZ1_9CORY|nr:N-acetyltransferase [Candidatus Corynebacterium gallistercoris]
MKKVTHDEANNRFVIEVDGEEAGFAEYAPKDGGVRDFNHTVVDSAYQGQGLSKILIQEALDNTKEAGGSIIATCSAVKGFVEKNSQYQDLIEG